MLNYYYDRQWQFLKHKLLLKLDAGWPPLPPLRKRSGDPLCQPSTRWSCLLSQWQRCEYTFFLLVSTEAYILPSQRWTCQCRLSLPTRKTRAYTSPCKLRCKCTSLLATLSTRGHIYLLRAIVVDIFCHIRTGGWQTTPKHTWYQPFIPDNHDSLKILQK